ncbi:PP2C family serine/threonine-protein phosphatase [Cobetia sp. QF-1]|uniref:PP2C family serine/threonine-protein phosphatase n=1 Tax=Cobetia sp. QF-1 TaxID=1969833 RepID=UPI000B540352|nr:PP2C family serine/threonine-protein phosphatase [Cobetia sp. QF-1]
MKHTHDYYAQIFMLLMTGKRGYYRPEVMDALMANTEAVALVDEFTERFQSHVAESSSSDTAEAAREDGVSVPAQMPLPATTMPEMPAPEMVTPEPITPEPITLTALEEASSITPQAVAPERDAAEPVEKTVVVPEFSQPSEPSQSSERYEASLESSVSSHEISEPIDAQETTLSPGDVPAPSVVPKEPSVSEMTRNIPNGRSGQSYQHDLGALLLAASSTVTDITLVDDGGTGLVIEDHQLIGELVAAGNFQLVVTGCADDGTCLARWTLRLAIIANPRDLWKTLPSDAQALYAKADCDVARETTPAGWQMFMASQRGRSHAHRGGQRDDHGVIQTTSTGWNILAVADGAGSCVLSRQGSLLASTRTVEGLAAYLEADEGTLEGVVLEYFEQQSTLKTPPKAWIDALYHSVFTSLHQGYKAICEEAQASNQPVKAFSTTLLLALHKPSPQGDLVITFGIGDGGIAVLETGRAATLMNHVDAGAHAGQTRFLDGAVFSNAEQDFYPRIRIQRFTALEALVLATDGITDPMFESDNDLQMGESWWRMFDDLAPSLDGPHATGALAEDSAADAVSGPVDDPLVRYLDFFTPGHHDDRTLAVLRRPHVARNDAGRGGQS